MQSAAEKFIELYENQLPRQPTNKAAYMAARREWEETYGFASPFKTYESFKRMLNYYHNEKKKDRKEPGIIGIKW